MNIWVRNNASCNFFSFLSVEFIFLLNSLFQSNKKILSSSLILILSHYFTITSLELWVLSLKIVFKAVFMLLYVNLLNFQRLRLHLKTWKLKPYQVVSYFDFPLNELNGLLQSLLHKDCKRPIIPCSFLDHKPWLERSYELGSVLFSCSFPRIESSDFSETSHNVSAHIEICVIEPNFFFVEKFPCGKCD